MWPFKKNIGKIKEVTVKLCYMEPGKVPMVLAPDRTNHADMTFIQQWFIDIRKQVHEEGEPAIGCFH